MKVDYRSSFLRDVKKIKAKEVKELIEEVIKNCKEAETIADIKNCSYLTSKGKFFKLKYNQYRLGVHIDNGVVEFIKFGTRENFYKDFPPF